MRTKTLFAIIFAGVLIVSGCKKEGLGGKKSIVGTVYFNDGVTAVDAVAPGAFVYITYDSKVSTGTVDETKTSDAQGAYSFKNLKNGNYFVWAEYTTSHGFKYTTQGHGVVIDAKKDKVNLNIRLY